MWRADRLLLAAPQLQHLALDRPHRRPRLLAAATRSRPAQAPLARTTVVGAQLLLAAGATHPRARQPLALEDSVDHLGPGPHLAPRGDQRRRQHLRQRPRIDRRLARREDAAVERGRQPRLQLAAAPRRQPLRLQLERALQVVDAGAAAPPRRGRARRAAPPAARSRCSLPSPPPARRRTPDRAAPPPGSAPAAPARRRSARRPAPASRPRRGSLRRPARRARAPPPAPRAAPRARRS